MKLGPIFIVVIFIASALAYNPKMPKDIIKQTVKVSSKTIIGALAEIKSSDDDSTKAAKLRDHIYSITNKIGTNINPTSIDFYRYLLTYFNLTENVCSSMAVNYIWLLSLYDIPAREVIIAANSFVSGVQEGDTHVMVEVFDGKTVYVSDPTFNEEFSCSNGKEKLDILGMKNCIENGNRLIPVYGKNQKQNRTLETYYISIERLLFAVRALPRFENDPIFKRIELPLKNWLQLTYEKHYKNETTATKP